MLERTYHTRAERRQRLVRRLVAFVLIAGALLLMEPIDRALYPLWLIEDVERQDWHQILRQFGDLLTWFIIALVVYLIDRRGQAHSAPEITPAWPPRPAHHRAGLIALSAILAGLLAEIAKGLIGRSRPSPLSDPQGVMIWLDRPLILIADHGGIGYGIPSSHTSTAFGGAVMLALLIPAIRWPMVLLAVGCGLSRLNAGAHATSDVLAGALIGWVVALLLFRAGQGVRRGPAGGFRPL